MTYSKGIHTIEIKELELDPLNPRLPERLKSAPENDVLNWMLSDATLVDLMASIVENGFFSGEPLLGINDPERPGKVVIVEGNRRLASVKLLHNPARADNKVRTVKELSKDGLANRHIPYSLPVYVVNNRAEISNYLGFRHVSGIMQWPVIAKARYLHSLFESRKWSSDIYRQLAKEIGSKSVYVRRLIIGYELYRHIEYSNFFDQDYLNEENFDLSLITDAATKYSEIASYMNINDINSEMPLSSLSLPNFKNVFEWLYRKNEKGETRLGESRNLPILNKVLATENAREAFVNEQYSLDEAAALTSLVDDNIRWHLQTARVSMIEAQKLVHTIKSPNKSDVRLVDEIRNSAETIRREMADKLITNETII